MWDGEKAWVGVTSSLPSSCSKGAPTIRRMHGRLWALMNHRAYTRQTERTLSYDILFARTNKFKNSFLLCALHNYV